MRTILLFALIIAVVHSENICASSAKQSKIECGKNEYIKIVTAEFGPITDANECPLTLDQKCKIDLKDQLEKACNYKGQCMILKEHYDVFEYDCPDKQANVAVQYTCVSEGNVAKQLWDAFNKKRNENNLYDAEWNEKYVGTAKTELETRLKTKGGFSDYKTFNTHDRLDEVAKEVQESTPNGIRYMMEFAAKLSTSVHPASTAITEWVNSVDEQDYRNMLYEYDLGGAYCDNYGNGWVCILHAVKLM